jgi:glycosyltransferase involved in cell wall biosynthesis
MKILFAIKGLHKNIGGAERVLTVIANHLAERGHDVSVQSFDREKEPSFYPLSDKVRLMPLGIGVTDKKADIFTALHRMCAFREVVIKERPDIVVAFMHSMFVPAAMALIGTGIKIVGSEHIVPQHYKNRPLEFFLFKCSAPFLSAITVISDVIKTSYPTLLRRKMHTIPNPVHMLEQPKRAPEKLVLNVGRLVDQKDQSTLIEAFSLIAKDYPDWSLMIVGKGPLKNALQDKIENSGLTERITIVPEANDIDSFYSRAGIFALSSKYESFGLATAEAMAFGVPCVGFANCPGTNELIIHNENGLLANGDDRARSFADCLSKLISEPETGIRLGRKAQETVQRYSPEKIAGQWEVFLRGIVQSA